VRELRRQQPVRRCVAGGHVGEVPVIDDQRGIAVDVGQQSGGYGGFTLVGGALGAERAHGGGVSAALGRKVAAEAEHVRPGDQSQVGELGKPAEAQAFGDVAAGVVADGQVGEPVGGGDAAVESAGAFGCFGGVLRDITGDLGVGQVSGGGDRTRVMFPAPGQDPGDHSRSGRGYEAHGADGLADGGGEEGEGGPGGRGAGRSAGPSSRMTAWKWTTPRRWYSATLA